VTDDNSFEAFTSFLEIMNKQQKEADTKRMAEIQKHWADHGEIIDKQLLLRIGYSSPEFVQALTQAHPAREHELLVENVDRAFGILEASRSALIDVAGRFHARVEHNTLREDKLISALNEATKEVYVYSCASTSLVQAYRRLISGWPQLREGYELLKAETILPAGVIAFVDELRDSNNHYGIIRAIPTYSVQDRADTGKEIKSNFGFDRERILSSKDWNTKAKEFVRTQESLEVLKIIDEHYGIVARFKRIFPHRLGIRSDKPFRDLKRIRYAQDLVGKRVWLGLMLQQALPKKLDPYEYLESWFSEEELEKIYSLPDHSSEQLEYMIALRDPLGFCDADTRETLYRLFSVPLDKLPQQEPEKFIEI
jgi:hypothetical protein